MHAKSMKYEVRSLKKMSKHSEGLKELIFTDTDALPWSAQVHAWILRKSTRSAVDF